MNMKEWTSKNKDVLLTKKEENTSSTGLTSRAIPEVQSLSKAEKEQVGVSTHCTLSATDHNQVNLQKDKQHWYALRTTYGREKKAYDYLVAKGVTAYYPTIVVEKEVRGIRKVVTESRLPNLFFAYGTEEEIQQHVYDNVNLPFLRFYYRHYHEGSKILKTPMIVPNREIESLKIICDSEAEDIIIVPKDVKKFKEGQKVRVIDGKFKGVEGRVARYQGQQRVAVIVEDVLTMATAYLPTAFLEYID